MAKARTPGLKIFDGEQILPYKPPIGHSIKDLLKRKLISGEDNGIFIGKGVEQYRMFILVSQHANVFILNHHINKRFRSSQEIGGGRRLASFRIGNKRRPDEECVKIVCYSLLPFEHAGKGALIKGGFENKKWMCAVKFMKTKHETRT